VIVRSYFFEANQTADFDCVYDDAPFFDSGHAARGRYRSLAYDFDCVWRQVDARKVVDFLASFL